VAAAGLAELAKNGPVLALGDFNECLAWDVHHSGHHCGQEFFENLEAAGLMDATIRSGVEERTSGPQAGYQVDRVVADVATCQRVSIVEEDLEFDDLADHAAIWFTLS
jgi:endonuclease/exonuclease/phosphatase family metal-dependent hydrolase